MTINRFNDNSDINIYFHMKNHYKKLRNVKSTIDTSAPQGFHKSCSTPPNTERSSKSYNFEERHVRNCTHLPLHCNIVKKHNCVSSAETQSETCVRSSSLPPRPITRRHPYEMPHKVQWKSRSQSVGPTSKKDDFTRLNKTKLAKKRRIARTKSNDQKAAQPQQENDAKSESIEANESNDKSSDKSLSSREPNGKIYSRTEEQEYLQFLLRITEDIIINNFYTNEDIEKVFQNHVEANKNHLKLGKMRAQLERLCGELNIPYTNGEGSFKKEDCYQHFFESDFHVFNCQQNFDSCECTTKRILEVETRNQNQLSRRMDEKEHNFNLSKDIIQTSFSILANKHSLSRVTECTEPCNSLDTLAASTKHPSGTTVSSLGYIDGVPDLESPKIEKESLEHETLANKRSPLTEKEKYGCMEEDLIFHKYNDKCSSRFEDTANIMSSVTIETDIQPCTLVTKSDGNLQTEKLEMKKNSSPENSSSENINANRGSSEQVENVLVRKPDTNLAEGVQRGGETTPEIKDEMEAVHANVLKTTHDKYTQISASCVDKQCNTCLKLNGSSKKDDYVLVNGPVYVLKTLLDSDEMLILYDNTATTDKDLSIVLEGSRPEKLVNVNIDIASNSQSAPAVNPEFRHEAFYLPRNNLSKLLHSDYDLTPQRDNNCNSGKYHNLSVNASTSVSNLDISNRLEIVTFNHDNLLLTENYTLSHKKEIQSKPIENNFVFSSHELSKYGQYEIKSYTLPKDINSCVGLSGYSISSQLKSDEPYDQMTEADVSLGGYEIYSQNGNLDVKDTEVTISEEVSESGEIKANVTNDADELSPQVSFRSEKGQNPSGALNITNNILGKRKMKHP